MLRRALFLLGMMLGAANADFQFTQITTGNISGYDHVAPGVPPTWKNDASGAARVGNINVIVDDLMSAVRMWNAYTDEAVSGQNIYLPTTHKDLEGATQIFDGTKLLITCSMTGPNDDDYNRLSRYDVDQINLGVLNEETLVMRPTIINYVNSTLGQQDPAWFARTQLYDEKSGNLNIEGISVTAPDSDYDFVWGFRGPLFGPTFATFDSKGLASLSASHYLKITSHYTYIFSFFCVCMCFEYLISIHSISIHIFFIPTIITNISEMNSVHTLK